MRRISKTPVDSFTLEILENRSLFAADLVAGGIAMLPAPSLSGPTISRPFIFSVVNMGDTTVPAGTQVNFYLSRDGVLDGADRLVRRSVLPSAIAPGQRVTYSKVTMIPQGIDDGYFQLIEKIDPANAIVESDETNNVLPSESFGITLPPLIESVTINKLYLRPGSQATLTAHNITNMDPGVGQVKFYRSSQALQAGVSTPPGQLLGIATRVGADFVLTFTADANWLSGINSFYAQAVKTGSQSTKGLQISGRRLASPTITSFSFTPLIHGQSSTFAASGVSISSGTLGVYFDSNFDGIYTPYAPGLPYPNGDRLFVATAGPGWTNSFTVPDWFPTTPTTVFVIIYNLTNGTQHVYSTLLSAH